MNRLTLVLTLVLTSVFTSVAFPFFTACKPESKEPAGTAVAATLNTGFEDEIDSILYKSENLVIQRISDHVYLHTSYLNTDSFGSVPCNGMIVVNGNKAVVFDTPAGKESSEELIRYLREEMRCNVVGVIATHFHADCVAGLATFHENKILSYASDQTISFLKDEDEGSITPNNSFAEVLELAVGDKKVYAEYFGAGHTTDNVIGYFPYENALFGGCLIKEIGAGKGNLEDANIKEWPETVKKIKNRYPKLRTVIPGHGKLGGTELLDYTIEMFEEI